MCVIAILWMPSNGTDSTAPGMPHRLAHSTRPSRMLSGVRFRAYVSRSAELLFAELSLRAAQDSGMEVHS